MRGPVPDAYAELGVAVAHVREALRSGLGTGELVEALREHQRLTAQLDALGLDLIGEAERRDLPWLCGATSPAAWLSGLLTMSPQAAANRVRTAAALDGPCTSTKQALAAGEIAFEQASAIARIVTDLPKDATAGQAALAEGWLLDRAPATNAHELSKLHKRVDALVDPEGLLKREEVAKKRRGAWIRANHDGTQTLRWTDTDERMAALKAALDPLAAPVPAKDGSKDERTPQQRRADGLADLIEGFLGFGDLPRARGHRPHVVVTISEDDLRAGTGFGTTQTGETLTALAVQRIACDALITPLRIDGNGVPLNVGRTRRTVTAAQWIALVARDGGCAFPDCTRPASWCQAHHCTHWCNHGPTDLENLVLLCDRHHDEVHHRGWAVEFAADRRPTFIPPEPVDPLRRPLRNAHWHTHPPARSMDAHARAA